MILDDIAEKRRKQLERDMSAVPFEEVRRAAEAAAKTDTGRSFAKAISAAPSPTFIAEVKKASPSKGIISDDFRPVEQALAYVSAGAAAISCLTEEYYFKGSAEYFKAIRQKVNIPMLRKDFIIHPYQIYEAKAMGADAILLIAAMLDVPHMREFREIAESLKMDVLAESHNTDELKAVAEAGCKIFGINNRDLKTFNVTLETTKALAELVPEGGVIVSESGIKTAEDIKFVTDCGAKAVLIGETLMRSGDPVSAVKELKSLL